MATASGFLPTFTVFTTVLVEVLMTLTVLEPKLVTWAWLPSGVMGMTGAVNLACTHTWWSGDGNPPSGWDGVQLRKVRNGAFGISKESGDRLGHPRFARLVEHPSGEVEAARL